MHAKTANILLWTIKTIPHIIRLNKLDAELKTHRKGRSGFVQPASF